MYSNRERAIDEDTARLERAERMDEYDLDASESSEAERDAAEARALLEQNGD